jgi:hypothetical protein
LENEEPREWVSFFLPNNQETPCPERHEHSGKSEMMHHLTGKLFPQRHEKAVLSIIARKVSPVFVGSTKKGLITLFFIKAPDETWVKHGHRISVLLHGIHLFK